MVRREFRLVDGKSSKFWTIELDGAGHTVRFGRIGTDGQVQAKDFTSDAAARQSYEKLVAEKMKKGYVEVGGGGPAPAAPATSPKPAKAAAEVAPAGPPVPSATPGRSVVLDEDDWLWATWRPRTVRPRPRPKPFDRDACLAQLAPLKAGTFAWQFREWETVGLGPAMSPEEAQFWIAAAAEASRPVESAEAFARIEAARVGDGGGRGWSPADVRKKLGGLDRHARSVVVRALANLFPVGQLVRLLVRGVEPWHKNPGHALCSTQDDLGESLAEQFRTLVLPYLTEAELAEVRAILRPLIKPEALPTDLATSGGWEWRPGFHLAARVGGFHEPLLACLRAFPDGALAEYEFRDATPSVVMGLGDGDAVAAEFRRLKLKLRQPGELRGFLAHTEWRAMDVVRDSVAAETNKGRAERLLRAARGVDAPEAAGPMLELKLKSKAATVARAWLDEHPSSTAAGLAPIAAGGGKLAAAARQILNELKRAGHAVPDPAAAAPAAAPPAAAPAVTPAPATPAAAEPVRSVALDEDDWLWATWRPRKVRPRPEPPAFDRKACLDRLAKLKPQRYSLSPDWDKLGVGRFLSPEEAHFWFAAAVAAGGGAPVATVVTAMKKAPVTGRLSKDEVRRQVAGDFSWTARELVITALLNLFPADELVSFLVPALGARHKSWQNPLAQAQSALADALANQFHLLVLPYLTDAELGRVRDVLRPVVTVDRMPAGPTEAWDVQFHLAARAGGFHDALLACLRRLPDGAYNDWQTGYSHGVACGLGDGGSVAAEFRRLGMRPFLPNWIRAFLAHTEWTALDVVRDAIAAETNKAKAETMLRVLRLVDAPEAAGPMLELKLNSKASAGARAWLEEHPRTAAIGLAPIAAGDGPLAAAARQMLAELKRAGHDVPDVPAPAGSTATAAAAAPVAPTPAWFTTAAGDLAAPAAAGGRHAKPLPFWAHPASLPPLVVHAGGGRFGEDDVALVLAALSRSTLAEPHPLVAAVREHATADSRDAFAWDLAGRWLAEGGTAKQRWAFLAAGLLGSDATALRLTPLVRNWPGRGQHPLAVLGLECLRAIGTDTALMCLNGIAQKLKFAGLKAKAAAFMNEIAREKGLTRAQLEDRVVPDCDLDERGTRVFDFGPRQFRFVLGPGMKPMVKDADGKARDDLPAPGAKDDAAKAKAAVEAWKLLKTQVREAAKVQAERLEQAMVTSRRWPVAEFDALLVRHPLMANLVRLLVWGGYGPRGKLLSTFRVTEDGTYADERDEGYALTGVESVGVVHPLHLTDARRAAWAAVLSDYVIVPPFPQLDRPAFRLEPGEEKAKEITRLKGIMVPAAALNSTLQRRGWARGEPMDAGIVGEHSKAFPAANVTAVVEYDGIPVYYTEGWDDQHIERCYFVRGVDGAGTTARHSDKVPPGKVDPVAVSEVLADLALLAAKGK